MASGQLFEKRLAAMFVIRATTESSDRYQHFEITMNDETLAGKFDDIIFRYREKEDQNWRYRFVRAKHKEDVNKKIDVNQLLVTERSDFYLPKYFQSFCRMVESGIQVDDCIIITNIDFNTSKFKENGLSLVEILPIGENEDQILHFEGFVKKPRRFRLKFTDEMILNEKLTKWCPMKELAKELSETLKRKQTPDLRKEIYKHYHVALVNENVIAIDSNKIGRFHPNFIDLKELLVPSAENLRQNLLDLCTLDELNSWTFTANKNFGQGPDQKLPKTSLEEKKQFFAKLVFIVQSPSQEEFIEVLEKNDIRRFYSKSEGENQIHSIFQQIENWITKKSEIVQFLSPQFGRNVLLLGVDKSSEEYINELFTKVTVRFNPDAIEQMAEEIRNTTSRILIIKSLTTDWTSVKVISAIRTMGEYNYEGDRLINTFQSPYDYNREHGKLWVTSNRKLENESNLWRERIGLREKAKEKTILVIVNEKNSSILFDPKSLLTDKTSDNIRFVVIKGIEGTDGGHQRELSTENTGRAVESSSTSCTGESTEFQDEISFQQLDHESQMELLEPTVRFKSSEIEIEKLIPANEKERNQVLTPAAVYQLWNEPTDFPEMDTTGYDESMYVSRKVMKSFKGSITDLLDHVAIELELTLDELHPEDETKSPTEKLQKWIQIDERGTMTWSDGATEEIKSKIWQTLKKEMESQEIGEDAIHQQESHLIPEEDLIEVDDPSRVIISGVAGTGKSTILSSLYHQIKNNRQLNEFVVVKIPLTEKPFMKFDDETTFDREKTVEFFLNLIEIKLKKKKGKDPFFYSLMRHRLTTGDRIFIFLDGFDEIGVESQNVLLKLIAKLDKSVRVYVTTRSHDVDKLQFEMSQLLTYKLVPLNRQGQIDFLMKIWRKDSVISTIDPSILEHFTSVLVDKLAESLKREENEDFIGIPLQCRILAECYQPKIRELRESNRQDDSKLKEELLQLGKEQNSNLASLYQLLEETKRNILQQDKEGFCPPGKETIFHNHYERLQKALTKLSVMTIVQNEDERKMLLSNPQLNNSEISCLNDYGTPSGFIYRNDSNRCWEFLQRTFAEYFVAKFIFNGFVLDEKSNNGLLDQEISAEWIISHLFSCWHQYRGVLTFLDSMLNDNQQLTDGLADLKTGTLLFNRYEKWTSQLMLRMSQANSFQYLKYFLKNVWKLILCCLNHWGGPNQIIKTKKLGFQSLEIEKKPLRGHLCEINLATLFFIRATRLGYQFEIKMGDEQLRGKFDDIIFRYRQPDEGDGEWRYRFVQTVHIDDANELIIDTDELTGSNNNPQKTSDWFLLAKYVASFHATIVQKRDVIDDCVMCTNVDIDTVELQQNGIDVVEIVEEDPIFNFNGIESNQNQKRSYRCRLKFTKKDRKTQLVNTWNNKMKMQPITEDMVDDFLTKLVFVVNSPNEEGFIELFRSKEFCSFYSEREVDIQTSLVVEKVKNWVKDPIRTTGDCLTPEFGRNVLLLGVDKSSEEYINELFTKVTVRFNADAIEQMAEEIRNSNSRILIIKSLTADWTSVKVISAIQTMNEYNQEHGQLWVSSNRKLENESNLWRERIGLREKAKEKTILVIVNETNSPILFDPKSLLTDKTSDNIRFVVIKRIKDTDGGHQRELSTENTGRVAEYSSASCDESTEYQDDISFQQLDHGSQMELLGATAHFQSLDMEIENLIPVDEKERIKVLTPAAVYQLWNKQSDFPAMDTTGYDQSMYVSRRVTMSFNGSIPDLIDRVAIELESTLDRHHPEDQSKSPTEKLKKWITMDDKGTVTWSDEANGEIKSKIWHTLQKEMKSQRKGENAILHHQFIKEEGLIKVDGPSLVIISGVAGSGKSTILFSLYHQIKNKYENGCAVVKISLSDQKFANFDDQSTFDQETAVEFFLNLIAIKLNKDEEKDPFFYSLMRYRLTTGDRIFIFLDGFDIIDANSQNVLLKLIAKLDKSVRVYVTTRTNEVDKLELEMSQLAYNLVPFNRQDQIDFLLKIWGKDSVISAINLIILEEFIPRLLDKMVAIYEREKIECLIGIPLKCRILAEYFSPKIKGLQYIYGKGQVILKKKLNQLVKEKKTITTAVLEQLFPPPTPGDGFYDIYDNGKNPGLALILSQQEFVNKDLNVPSHEFDSRRLQETFQKLGFTAEVTRNQTAAQIKKIILDTSKDKRLEDYNSLVVCLLSHGDSEAILGSDGRRAAIHKLEYAFNSHDCPAMHDKPKIFIIQACRIPRDFCCSLCISQNEDFYEGWKFLGLRLDGVGWSNNLSRVTDFLSIMATIKGNLAFANPLGQSQFINILCSKLEENGRKSKDLNMILNELTMEMTNKRVSVDDEQLTVQTPERISTLRKNIVLRTIQP